MISAVGEYVAYNKSSSDTKVPSFGKKPLSSDKVFKHSDSRKLIKKPNILERTKDFVAEGFARTFGFFASIPPVQKIVGTLRNTNNYMRYLTSGVSVLLTASTVRKYKNSKKIEEEQKLPLILNQLFTTAVTISAGFLIDQSLDEWFENKFVPTFNKVNEKLIAKKTGVNWTEGLKNAKTFFIFALIYRYVGPVIVTPIANRVSTIMVERRNLKNTQLAAKQAS